MRFKDVLKKGLGRSGQPSSSGEGSQQPSSQPPQREELYGSDASYQNNSSPSVQQPYNQHQPMYQAPPQFVPAGQQQSPYQGHPQYVYMQQFPGNGQPVPFAMNMQAPGGEQYQQFAPQGYYQPVYPLQNAQNLSVPSMYLSNPSTSSGTHTPVQPPSPMMTAQGHSPQPVNPQYLASPQGIFTQGSTSIPSAQSPQSANSTENNAATMGSTYFSQPEPSPPAQQAQSAAGSNTQTDGSTNPFRQNSNVTSPSSTANAAAPDTQTQPQPQEQPPSQQAQETNRQETSTRAELSPEPQPAPTPVLSMDDSERDDIHRTAPVSEENQTKANSLKDLGNASVSKKDWAQAEQWYSMALDYDPSNPIILANRSMVYILKTSPDFEAALDDARKATQIDPTYWKGWSRLGDVRMKMNNYDGAVTAYKKAIETGGGNVSEVTKASLRQAELELKSRQPAADNPPRSNLNVRAEAPASKSASTSAQTPSNSSGAARGTTSPASNTQSRQPPAARQASITSTPATTSAAKSTPASARPAPANTADTRSATANTTSAGATATNTAGGSSTGVGATQGNPAQPAAPSVWNTFGATSGAQSAQGTQSASQPYRPEQAAATAPSAAPTTTASNQQFVSGSGLPAELVHAMNDMQINEDDLNAELPPSYTPNLNSSDPVIRAMSQQQLQNTVRELENTLKIRNKGACTVKAYTSFPLYDAVQAVYVGMIQSELTAREYGGPPPQHSVFNYMYVNQTRYPGSGYIDMDMETSKYHYGKIPGTVSISGFSEKYREQQRGGPAGALLGTRSTNLLPYFTIDQLVQKLEDLVLEVYAPTTVRQKYDRLRVLLGPDTNVLAAGEDQYALKNQISDLCKAINRTNYFADLSKAANISNNTLRAPPSGVGLQRLTALEGWLANIEGKISDPVSATLVIADLWMINVHVGRSPGSLQYVLYSRVHNTQVDGLINFAQQLRWPYMDELRTFIESAYVELTAGRMDNLNICDWLFGLILPGKMFTHKIMSCLVYSSPTIRSFGTAPTYSCGLVLPGKSYWPAKSTLGSVLGGLKNVVCLGGWIGPTPKPLNSENGWVRVVGRNITINVPYTRPANEDDRIFANCLTEEGMPMSTEERLTEICDLQHWIKPVLPKRQDQPDDGIDFKAIRLNRLADAPLGSTTIKEFNAVLDFTVKGKTVSFTLFSNPIFVNVHPCVGDHIMYKRTAKDRLSNVVNACDLADINPPFGELMVINATKKGEELFARAWCAARNTNAAIWRNSGACLTCALNQTSASTGLAVNVLIWSSV